MRKIAYCICLLVVVLFFNGCKTDSGTRKVLLFVKTKGYHHESIPAGIAAIEKIGKENNFSVDVDSNSNVFNDDDLKKYKAVIFLSTTGNILNSDEQIYLRYGGRDSASPVRSVSVRLSDIGGGAPAPSRAPTPGWRG